MSQELYLLQQASDRFAMHYVVAAKSIVEHLGKSGYEVVWFETTPSELYENNKDRTYKIVVKNKNNQTEFVAALGSASEMFETIHSPELKKLIAEEKGIFNQMMFRYAVKVAYNILIKGNHIHPIQINKL